MFPQKPEKHKGHRPERMLDCCRSDYRQCFVMQAAVFTPQQAYQHCLQEANRHYENFPVASKLLPSALRAPVAAIYSFARRSDDLADEGASSDAQRLAGLDAMAQAIDEAATGRADPTDATFVALADAMSRYALPVSLFHDLLTAFRQDVTHKRYADFGELMQYCRCSANPIGRLLLHLGGEAEARKLALSDAVCSSLQLINFYQDLAQDYEEMGRIYLPQDEMQRFGVTEAHVAERRSDGAMRALMQFQYQRADKLLRSGAPLGRELSGRLGLEIRFIINAGARVLWLLRRQEGDLFSRPRLSKKDYLRIAADSVWPKRRSGA